MGVSSRAARRRALHDELPRSTPRSVAMWSRIRSTRTYLGVIAMRAHAPDTGAPLATACREGGAGDVRRATACVRSGDGARGAAEAADLCAPGRGRHPTEAATAGHAMSLEVGLSAYDF